MICRFCNADTAAVLIPGLKKEGRLYSVLYCSDCHLGFTDPFPSKEELSELYSTSVYRLEKGKRFNLFVEFILNTLLVSRRKRIEKIVNTGSILDIGCGRGSFLHEMRLNGWRVAGTEFNDETASYAREGFGINISADLAFKEDSFDVITINHVLEHIPDPDQTIKKCYGLLKKEGLLVIAVPNLDSIQAVAGRGDWLHLDVPYHLVHFSEKGLRKLLERNRYRIIKTRRFDAEHNPFGWLQTLLNLSGAGENYLYNLLKAPDLKKSIPSNKKALILTILLTPLYLPVSLLLALAESFLFNRGGTFEIWAVKLD